MATANRHHEAAARGYRGARIGSNNRGGLFGDGIGIRKNSSL
jgi:hypothetical protein